MQASDPPKIGPKSGRVSRDDWLTRGLQVLAAEGVQGIRIERLARDLNVAKAGFYWHFRDRQELLESMLEHWSSEFTVVITDNQDMRLLAPEQRLYQTMVAILENDLAKYELAIRSWAAHDPAADKVLRRVYADRMEFARQMFSELGFRGRELEMRTRLFLCYDTWDQATFDDLSKDERRQLLRLRHKFLTTK